MLNSFIEPYGWGWKKYTPPSSSSSFRISPTIIEGGGPICPKGKLAIFDIFLHSRQQQKYQGTLGT